MKYTILFPLLIAVCYCTDNIVNIDCGINTHKKQTDLMWYAFNEEIEEGQIEFYGKVYEMKEPIYIYLYRGVGSISKLEHNCTLYIEVSRFNEKLTYFKSRKLDNIEWTNPGSFKIEETLFNHDDDNVLTITILKDRFEIYSNHVHKWTSSRIVDPGVKIKAAAIKGLYQPEKITLTCESTVPADVPRGDDDDDEE